MNLKEKTSRRLAYTLAIVLITALSTMAKKPDAGKSKYDKGKKAIDISSYPPEIKKLYPLVKEKCASCHSFARAVNAPYTDAQWRRYVKRMMAKPDSGIDNKSGKKIFTFLKHYNKARKK